MIEIKQGVRIKSVDQAMSIMLSVVVKVYEKYGYDTIITSANDGQHMSGSKHYLDAAYDFRTHHISDSDVKHKIIDEIKSNLGELFDCLFESEGKPNEHLHVEIH